ncbi:MAG: ribonuclease HI [Saprospiraceae bacterium]|jgi:ribonuclease HI
MSKKFYVVWEGNNVGVFDSWPQCQLQIKGYANAKYKSFKTREAAEAAYHGNFSDHIGIASKAKKPQISDTSRAAIVWKSIAVDAACSGNPGDMEYRGVDTATGDEIFKIGVFKKGTNNVGEFLALVHGLAYLQQIKAYDLPIYTDSKTAIAWVRNKKAKTNLKRSAVNDKLFVLIERGEKWLKMNTWKNPIIKWKTEEWGEIPADFGRK